jgi:hypothetical protein
LVALPLGGIIVHGRAAQKYKFVVGHGGDYNSGNKLAILRIVLPINVKSYTLRRHGLVAPPNGFGVCRVRMTLAGLCRHQPRRARWQSMSVKSVA